MQKAAYEVRISDWSSDVCSSDLGLHLAARDERARARDREAGDIDAEHGDEFHPGADLPPVAAHRRSTQGAHLLGRRVGAQRASHPGAVTVLAHGHVGRGSPGVFVGVAPRARAHLFAWLAGVDSPRADADEAARYGARTTGVEGKRESA